MNTQEIPFFSICIPTYNRSHYLSEAIRSCLAQTYQDFEICISSNASTDGTAEMMSTYCTHKISFFQHPNPILPYENWNTAITIARGKYILFLSDDDLLMPEYLEVIKSLIELRPTASLYRTGLSCIDANGLEKWSVTSYPDFETPFDFVKARCVENRHQFLPGITVKRKHVVEVRGFIDNCMPAMLYLDDYFWFRLVLKGDGVASSPRALWSYRQHSDQYGGKPIDMKCFYQNAGKYSSLLYALLTPNISDQKFIDYLAGDYATKIIDSRLIHEYNRFGSIPKKIIKHDQAALADTCFIICNGPSLATFDYSSLNGLATVCLNYSYRFLRSAKWKPKYYVCVDLFALQRIHNNFDELLKSLPESASILLPDAFIRKSKLLRGLDRCMPSETISYSSLHEAVAQYSSMIASIYLACSEGYKKIVLVGADLFYCKAELDALYSLNDVNGHKVLSRTKSLLKRSEYNYSRKNYHEVGDMLYCPSPELLGQEVMHAYYRLAAKGIMIFRLEGMPTLLEQLPCYPHARLSLVPCPSI